MTERRCLLALWCALGYLILAPLVDALNLRFHFPSARILDMQRVIALAPMTMLVLLVVPALLVSRRLALAFSNRELAGWALFFALGAISSGLAEYPVAAWLEWSWVASFFVFTVLLASTVPNDRQLLEQNVATAVLCAVAVYVLDFYVVNGGALFDPDPIGTDIRFPGFNNVRVFSDHQTVLLFLIPSAVALHVHSTIGRLAAHVVAGLFFALAFAAASRSLFAGHAVGCVVLIVLLGRRSVTPLFWLGRYWLLGAMLFIWIFPDNGQGIARTGSSGRTFLWERAISMAIDHPWWGVGPMHFSSLYNPIAASTHNHVLQLMAEWGLPATAVFLLMAGFFARRYVLPADSGSSPPDFFRSATIAALAALVAQSFVSPVFNNPTSQMALALLIAITVRTSDIRTPGRYDVTRVAFAAAAVVCLVLTTTLIARWLPWIQYRNNCFASSKERWSYADVLYPRFWEQGYMFKPCGGPEFSE